MTLIADGQWEIGYQSDGTDLIRAFYEPVLEDAVRYDRLTGYFDARALTLAVRGVEGLVRNDGRMRLIVGCTLNEEEVAAIERGEQLRDRIWKKLESISLQPFSAVSRDALALLAWMIAKNILEIRVAVPCDDNGNPTTSCAIFHAKSGIVEDRFGDKIAWNGSLNETESGWRHNWEKFDVYVGKRYPEFVTKYEREFADIWEGRERRLLVMGVPDAVRDQLLQFLPDDDQPPAPLKNRKRRQMDTMKPSSRRWCGRIFGLRPCVPTADSGWARRPPRFPLGPIR
ncbi:hypothetical protein KKC22_00245 [Myxococcota bacterium]|nr:hypothetical protein [Myxococcota bacterium]